MASGAASPKNLLLACGIVTRDHEPPHECYAALDHIDLVGRKAARSFADSHERCRPSRPGFSLKKSLVFGLNQVSPRHPEVKLALSDLCPG